MYNEVDKLLKISTISVHVFIFIFIKHSRFSSGRSRAYPYGFFYIFSGIYLSILLLPFRFMRKTELYSNKKEYIN